MESTEFAEAWAETQGEKPAAPAADKAKAEPAKESQAQAKGDGDAPAQTEAEAFSEAFSEHPEVAAK